jgi:catechol 2,3-dioxygenase-like lactoylglutathione lyase family enzyme
MKNRSPASAAPASAGTRITHDRTVVVDTDTYPEVRKLKGYARPRGLGFQVRKIGHVVLNCRDLERSTRFYTEVLGLQVSDAYPQEMAPGGMVFLRLNTDHHGIGLVGLLYGESPNVELHHIAFEVGTLDEVLVAAKRLREAGVPIDLEGRRRAGAQIAVEFRDPDGHRLEIYWGIDQVGSDGRVRPPGEWKGARSFREAIENPVPRQDTTLRDPSLLDELDPRRGQGA